MIALVIAMGTAYLVSALFAIRQFQIAPVIDRVRGCGMRRDLHRFGTHGMRRRIGTHRAAAIAPRTRKITHEFSRGSRGVVATSRHRNADPVVKQEFPA